MSQAAALALPQAAPEPRPPGRGEPGLPRPTAGAAGERAVAKAAAAGTVMRPATEQAAARMFAGREVSVSTHYDKEALRTVLRVVDRVSGEVLAQFPPEELLRFYAAGLADHRRPLVSIDA